MRIEQQKNIKIAAPRYARAMAGTCRTSFPAYKCPPSTSARTWALCHRTPPLRRARTRPGASGYGNAVRGTSAPCARFCWLTDLEEPTAHIIADLALEFAPGIDISHVFAATVPHVHAHPGLYEYIRLALRTGAARVDHARIRPRGRDPLLPVKQGCRSCRAAVCLTSRSCNREELGQHAASTRLSLL